MPTVDDPMTAVDRSRFQALQREALEALMRVTSDDVTVAELRAFRAWRRRSEAHARAYRSALGIWRSLGTAAEETVTAGDRALLVPRPPSSSGVPIGRRMVLGGGLAAAAAAGVTAVLRPPLGLWPPLSDLLADYHTGAGEQRTIAVAEGVAAQLNTRTAVGRRPVGQGRAIELISGEVAVTSACRDDDPFTVVAGTGRIRSTQARFDVRHDGDAVRVTCLDGTVEVEQAGTGTTLRTNQQASYSRTGIGTVGTVDPALVTAWQHGLLIFRDQPLWQVIEEVNRYWSGRIIVLGSALAERRVTARIELQRIGEVIAYVRAVLGAEVRTLPGGVVLLS